MATLKVVVTSNKAMAKFDIKGAYLNADPDEELYIDLDPTITNLAVDYFPELDDFVETGKLTVRLDKALYGLVQCTKRCYLNISTYWLCPEPL